ncbi:hypothetical protein I7X12_08430 [Halosimplex litoreum]|uniref:Uncharacterized protein n=1 Tax=Halosimplex litoreum TaxID=1198301 RepID=A0A7U3WAH4_9EURY|nr:hypothetical protein [Halosimplex litoreum]QPV64619.1 hypothetical protein I7X12_08430 [Halosimplex litoreum]
MSDDFETELAAAFEAEFDADAETVATAAENAAAFREDFDEDLAVEDVLDRAEGHNGDFEHRFDYAVGDLADGNDDCTDSREYRIAGYDPMAADPNQGF